MKQVKSKGTVKKMAEVSDISCWPVDNSTTTFQPGTHYDLGVRTQPFSYTLAGSKNGAEWSFSFETEGGVPQITHPAGVKIEDFDIETNQHVEVNIRQVGSYKWLVAYAWSRS